MPSSTYRDIIEDKIADWKSGIEKLEEHALKASSDTQVKLTWKITQLKAAIETATLQLRDLDSQENQANTVEIKDKILKIFDDIDKDLTVQDDKTPYML